MLAILATSMETRLESGDHFQMASCSEPRTRADKCDVPPGLCTSVIPCLSSGLAENNKLCPCLSYFPGIFGHFQKLAFFRKWGVKPYIKRVKNYAFTQFFNVPQLSDNFSKMRGCFDLKVRTNLTTNTYRRLFQQELCL